MEVEEDEAEAVGVSGEASDKLLLVERIRRRVEKGGLVAEEEEEEVRRLEEEGDREALGGQLACSWST